MLQPRQKNRHLGIPIKVDFSASILQKIDIWTFPKRSIFHLDTAKKNRHLGIPKKVAEIHGRTDDFSATISFLAL